MGFLKDESYRSILVYLLAKNLPLSHWPEYVGKVDTQFATDYWSGKALDNAARKMVNALSQYSVAEQMAREWEGLPAQLRMRITAIANAARGFGHISNNVTKGIQHLDNLLGGKVLARQIGPTERRLVIIGGRKVSVDREINPAIAGAQRAFAGYALPPNFSKMSKAEQKKIRTQLAAERRELKRR